jgi:hypothetical protein
MRTRSDWQTIEVFVKAVMKTLLTLTALFALTASAATEWYKLILVTQSDHFDPQMGNFATLRECTTEGARLLHDQNIYAGFGCVFWEESEHEPEEESEHAGLVPLTITARAQENPSEKQVVQPPEPYVLTLFPQFLEGVNAFDTREACTERGMEFLAATDIFNGFVCEHGRAWQKDE